MNKTCKKDMPMSSGHGTRREQRRGEGKSAVFALATDRFLAPLICRVVHAVRVPGAGLGFSFGEPSVLRPKTSDLNASVPKACQRNVNLGQDGYGERSETKLGRAYQRLFVIR